MSIYRRRTGLFGATEDTLQCVLHLKTLRNSGLVSELSICRCSKNRNARNFCTLHPHFPESTFRGPDVEECPGAMIRRRTVVRTLSASLQSLEATTACNTLSLALREADICIPLGSMDPGAWLFSTSHSHSFDHAESFAKSSCPS